MILIGEKKKNLMERARANVAKVKDVISSITKSDVEQTRLSDVKKKIGRKIAAVLLAGTAGLSITGCTSEKVEQPAPQERDTHVSVEETPKFVYTYSMPNVDSFAGKTIKDKAHVTIKKEVTDVFGNVWCEVSTDEIESAWVPKFDVCSDKEVAMSKYIENPGHITIGGKVKDGQSIEAKMVTSEGEQTVTLPYGYTISDVCGYYGLNAGASVVLHDYNREENQVEIELFDHSKNIYEDPSAIRLLYIDADCIKEISEINSMEDTGRIEISTWFKLKNEMDVNGEIPAQDEETQFVNVRSGPSTGYDKVGKLRDGQRIALSNEDDEGSYAKDDAGDYWRKIGDNTWIKSELLRRVGYAYDGHIAKGITIYSNDASSDEILVYEDEKGEEHIAPVIVHIGSSSDFDRFGKASIIAVADSNGGNSRWLSENPNRYYEEHKKGNRACKVVGKIQQVETEIDEYIGR